MPVYGPIVTGCPSRRGSRAGPCTGMAEWPSTCGFKLDLGCPGRSIRLSIRTVTFEDARLDARAVFAARGVVVRLPAAGRELVRAVSRGPRWACASGASGASGAGLHEIPRQGDREGERPGVPSWYRWDSARDGSPTKPSLAEA